MLNDFSLQNDFLLLVLFHFFVDYFLDQATIKIERENDFVELKQ
jgi:hypothetical protein